MRKLQEKQNAVSYQGTGVSLQRHRALLVYPKKSFLSTQPIHFFHYSINLDASPILLTSLVIWQQCWVSIPFWGIDTFRYLISIPKSGIDIFQYLTTIPILRIDTFRYLSFDTYLRYRYLSIDTHFDTFRYLQNI